MILKAFRTGFAAAFAVGLCATFPAGPASARESCAARVPDGHLTADVKGFHVDLPIFSVFVMPGETVRLTPSQTASVEAPAGVLSRAEGAAWLWTAPDAPGLVPLRLRGRSQQLLLNAFVMRPAGDIRDGRMDGYRIGGYSRTPFRGLSVYLPPKGFVRVDRRMADTPLTPLFKIGQFVSKQAGGWPKYVVLREELLLKLHQVADLIERAGFDSCGIVVMSGYRTPFYNAAIGNGRHSRHVYGGAADIYLDADPKDGVMDDLNRDGRIDKNDAAVLYDLIAARRWTVLRGGLGEYGANAAHGPFVHVDARGYRARWGRSGTAASSSRRGGAN